MRAMVGILTCLAAGALSQGCAPLGRPSGGERVFAVDQAGGAKLCEPGKVEPKPGASVDVGLKMGNDNGWCAISVSQSSRRAYDAGLLTQRPAHGRVAIKRVGDATRIDYTPHAGFVGTDKFAVKLIPSDAALAISATVVGK